MKLVPERIDSLSPERRENIINRSMEDISSVYEHVRKIVEDVKQKGDSAILDMSREFKDDVVPSDLLTGSKEIEKAYNTVEPKVIDALKSAAQNIIKFHRAQIGQDISMEVNKGVFAGRITRPIERVGCYIPGGRAAYPSTVLMTILPAKVAGVAEIVATTPPGKGMELNPATLVAADIAGCSRIFKVAGPWGIAGLAYGTETMPRVDKIVGPGNKYVTAAKMLVYGHVDIDSPAGPSEALILADETGFPEWIAADLLSQAEHDPESAAVLISTSGDLARLVCDIINRAYPSLPRKEIFELSLSKHSCVLIAGDLKEAIDFANEYAAEHLQILTKDPYDTLKEIKHAGSIFLGPYAPVPVGDYASGTNHVLPTGRCARMFSGLSVDDFIRKPTFQHLDKEGLTSLRDIVVTLAEAEGLPMHAKAVEARFKKDNA
jgi:histidinol dehydrogenase